MPHVTLRKTVRYLLRWSGPVFPRIAGDGINTCRKPQSSCSITPERRFQLIQRRARGNLGQQARTSTYHLVARQYAAAAIGLNVHVPADYPKCVPGPNRRLWVTIGRRKRHLGLAPSAPLPLVTRISWGPSQTFDTKTRSRIDLRPIYCRLIVVAPEPT